jgi:SpoIIAA-like
MIEILPGYPDQVLAVSGTGHVSERDYRDVLIPEADARIGRHGRVRLLYLLGHGYDGLDPTAAWSDLKFGVSRWSKFGRIALVTDVAWIKNAARLFAPFFHHAFRIFDVAELEEASAWIRAADNAA